MSQLSLTNQKKATDSVEGRRARHGEAFDRLNLLEEAAFRALKGRNISWHFEGARIVGSGHHNDSTIIMQKP